MASTSNLEFINTKLHARKARLYQGDRLRALLDAQDLAELIRKLLPDEAAEVGPGLERILHQQFLKELNLFCNYLTDPALSLIQAIIEGYFIDNLKVLARAWARKSAGEEIAVKDVQHLLVEIPGYPALPIEGFLSAQSWSEFAAVIPSSKFRHIFSSWAETDSERYYLEAMLETSHQADIAQSCQALAAEDRQTANQIFGRLRDAAYLGWIFRLKFTYKVSWDWAKVLFKTPGWLLSLDNLANLYTLESPLELQQALPRTYRELTESMVAEANYAFEDVFLTKVASFLRQNLILNLHNLSVLLSYYVFRMVEILNLTRIIEGFRLGFKPEDINRHLIQY